MSQLYYDDMAAFCSIDFISRIVSSFKGGSHPSNGPSEWFWCTSGSGTRIQNPWSPWTFSLIMSSLNLASIIPRWHLLTYIVVSEVFTGCIGDKQLYVGKRWTVRMCIWAGQSFFLDSRELFRRFGPYVSICNDTKVGYHLQLILWRTVGSILRIAAIFSNVFHQIKTSRPKVKVHSAIAILILIK